MEQRKELTWNSELEKYLCDTAERAVGYAWLHKRCEEMYSHRTTFLDIPTIVIGAVNGFISVGSNQIFGNDTYAPVYIGAISLFVSLLNTVSSYFSWGRRAEGHKIASNNFSKLYRYISIEMSTKPREERMSPKKLLEYVKNAYDQLVENGPLIDPTIIAEFNRKFTNVKDLSLPEETNGLHAVEPYKVEVVVPPNTPVQMSTPPPSIESLPSSLSIGMPFQILKQEPPD